MKTWPFAVAIAMLAATLLLQQNLSHGEPAVDRAPFETFPLTLEGRWAGKELGMEQEILDLLKLSDFMMRAYQPVTQRDDGTYESTAGLPVWLYVGFYASQRTGSSYHSPKNCLPGAGWQIAESVPTPIHVSDGAGEKEIIINKVLIEKGLDKQLILYWYQDRGRVIASEYSAKAFLIWDAMTQNRTDGSLVRVSVPVAGSVDDAFAHGVGFIQDIWPNLGEHLPKAS